MTYSSDPVTDADRETDAQGSIADSRDAAFKHAAAYVTGGDAELTRETLVEFLSTQGYHDPAPMSTNPPGWTTGPASNADLVCILLYNQSDAMTATAVRELRARLLAAPYTKQVIDLEVDRLVGDL